MVMFGVLGNVLERINMPNLYVYKVEHEGNYFIALNISEVADTFEACVMATGKPKHRNNGCVILKSGLGYSLHRESKPV